MSPFSLREVSDVLVVVIEEPAALNDFRSNAFRDALYDAVTSHDGDRFAIDLTKADFLSSSGLAILVGLKRRVDAKPGKLVLFGVHPVVDDLLKITRLKQFFTFATDEAAALALLPPVPSA